MAPIAAVSKTNPNPRILIPWMLVSANRDWTLEQVRMYAASQHLIHSCTFDPPGVLQSVEVRLEGGAWWKFIWDDSHSEVLRRPKLKVFQSYQATYTGSDGRQHPTNQPAPHFYCSVCGRNRPLEEARTVACGVDRYHADDFLVCPMCILQGALDASRRMGYFVQEK